MDSPHFYIALFIHLASLILGFGAVLTVDTFGLLMILNKIPLSLLKKTANVTQRLIWAGWAGMVISGVNLIWLKGYVDSLTKIKLFFVLMIGINGVFLHLIKKALNGFESKKDVPNVWRFRAALSTAVSQTGWWGAILIGFVHRHIAHNIAWPKNPYAYMLAIAAVFGLAAMMGEKILKNQNVNIKN